MKVNDPNSPGVHSTQVGRSQQSEQVTGARSSQSAAISGGGDEVQLSNLSRELRALEEGSPEREAHLEKLAEEYASGRYRPDTAAVSSAIIREALDDKQVE